MMGFLNKQHSDFIDQLILIILQHMPFSRRFHPYHHARTHSIGTGGPSGNQTHDPGGVNPKRRNVFAQENTYTNKYTMMMTIATL